MALRAAKSAAGFAVVPSPVFWHELEVTCLKVEPTIRSPARFGAQARGEGMRRLLMVTNLFPDQDEPWRGLDNATVLEAMRQQRPQVDVRVLALRPRPWPALGPALALRPRLADQELRPIYARCPYLPWLGGLNDVLLERGLRRARQLLPEGWQPDALLVPWLFPDACGAALHRAWRHLPLVAVAQGSDVHRYLQWPMRRRAILALSRRAQIISRSEELRQRLIAAGAQPNAVITVHNGVDRRCFRPGDSLVERQSLGLPQESALVLFVGNFLPVKGLDLLLESFALARRSVPGAQLALIGGGPLESALRSRAQALGLVDQVRWLGRLGPAEISQWMRAAHLLCLSSHHEGLPNVILEALSCGCPVLSTDVGGIREVIGPSSVQGRLVAGRDSGHYAQAMLYLLALGRRGALDSASEIGDWHDCAGKYWRVLENGLV